ncbi:MAG: RDD family protein [Cycloclasticus sp.]
MDVKNYAVSWKRFVAGIIDIIIAMTISYIFVIILLSLLVISAGVTDPSTLDKVGYIGYIIDILYFSLMESSSKQGTIGKILFRIKVTDLNGSQIGLSHAITRNVAKIISAMLLFIGFIMIPFTERRQGLHDLIAKCLVLDKASS